MRKLKVQVQASLDGYMAGPDGAMDWMAGPWSDDVGEYVEGLMQSVDTIVLGRRLAEGFIPAWASGPEGEDEASIDWMNNTPKVVVTNSLTESPWAGVELLGGDVDAGIRALKERDGGDLIAYGGGTLVASLIAAGLVDEVHLIVNPTAVGTGMPIFPRDGAYHRLLVADTRSFDCGMAAVRLEPDRG